MAVSRKREDVVNFAPGPAALPTEVIVEAQGGALNYGGLGIGMMEMSHRSTEFAEMNKETMDLLRSLLNIPGNYEILFLQGGGTGQFAAVPLNLTRGSEDVVDYLVTGQWSSKAAKEAEKYATVHYPFPKMESFTCIPPREEWQLSPNATYVYFCDNETVHGVEFPGVPEVGGACLVSDVSSNFITRAIDISKFGLLYAGVQKNVGCAGLTVVIVRKDLLGSPRRECPIILDYTVQAKAKSLYNTPNVWAVYIFSLMLKWVRDKGGVQAMEGKSTEKSQMLVEAIQSSGGYFNLVVQKGMRSRVNIPFRIWIDDKPNPDEEKRFVEASKKANIIHINGHRSVGGLRASLYNAVSVKDTQYLIDFMVKFMKDNKSS